MDESRDVPAFSEAVRVQAELLSHANSWTRHGAVGALANMASSDPSAVSALAMALRSSDPEVRSAATGALGHLGPRAAPAIPELERVLLGDDPDLGASAAAALGTLGSGPSVMSLARAAKGKGTARRRRAIEALAALGSAAPEAVQALIAALKDRVQEVRVAAARALATLRPADPKVATALGKALGDKDSGMRGEAFRSLAKLGPSAAPAAEALLSYLARTGSGRADGIRLLTEIAAASVPALVKALGDSEPVIREFAAVGLGAAGPAAGEALGELRRRLEDASPDVRTAAAVAVWGIGGKAEEALPILEQGLARRESWARIETMRRAALLGRAALPLEAGLRACFAPREEPVAPTACARLLAALGTSEAEVAIEAAVAWWRISSESEPALQGLGAAAEHADGVVRARAARLLGEMGQEARPLIGRLRALLEDTAPVVREAARAAMERV